MVAAGREEGRTRPHPLGHLEAKHAAIEAERAFQISHLQMHVADTGLGMDGLAHEGKLSAANLAG